MRNKTWRTHERLAGETAAGGSSDRGFGIVFAAVFAIVAAVNLYRGGDWWVWLLAAAAVMLGLACLAPAVLGPFNRAWTAFGLVLHRLVSPVMMGIVYLAAVMPTALVMRLLRIRPLDLAFDRSAKSYWICRDETDSQPQSLRRQF